jgi:hypothetical protein
MTPTRTWAKRARFTYDVPNSGGTAMPEPDDFLPILTAQHELAEPIADLANRPLESGRPYGRLLTLVRVHTRPIGVALIDLPGDGLSGEEVAHGIWACLESAIIGHLAADGLPPIRCLPRRGLSPGADLSCIAARRRVLAAGALYLVRHPLPGLQANMGASDDRNRRSSGAHAGFSSGARSRRTTRYAVTATATVGAGAPRLTDRQSRRQERVAGLCGHPL